MLFCTLCYSAHCALLHTCFYLCLGVYCIVTKKPRIQIHPIGTNFISAVPPKFLMWKMKTSWSYLYIHDKTLNSRNEWGNVIPYQIFHSSGMRLAWEFRFCLNLRKLFSRWASLSVRKIGSYCARSLPLPWYDNTEIAEMSRSFSLLCHHHFQ